MADEGGWVIVTCDSGRARDEIARLKGPPLHLILPAHRITGFYMSGKIAQASGFEKIRAVVYLLPRYASAPSQRHPAADSEFILTQRVMPSGRGHLLNLFQRRPD